jgi:hypothetical protein
MNSYKSIMVLLIALAIFAGCRGNGTGVEPKGGKSLDNVSAVAWDKLAGKRIFFGHQSVGYNIMDGVGALLKENPSIRLTIVETTDASRFNAPVFAHAGVGRNENPGSKCEAFEQYMDLGIGSRADIAFFKFCYVDINRETDVEKVFDSYKATVRRVKTKYPGMTLVHVTVPLTSAEYTLAVRLKSFIKRILGRVDENVARGELNERIRKEYSGSDQIFDLAAIESTSPTGESVTFTYKGRNYPCMYSGYTADGGHLNEAGKRVAAVGLLQTLLRVVEIGETHR